MIKVVVTCVNRLGLSLILALNTVAVVEGLWYTTPAFTGSLRIPFSPSGSTYAFHRKVWHY
jgi:hypothetical protein